MAKENGKQHCSDSHGANNHMMANKNHDVMMNENECSTSSGSGSGTPSLSVDCVPFLPITVDENDIIRGAKEILKAIRPNWDPNAINYKFFTDGITNKLIGCFHQPKEENSSSSSSSSKTAVTNNNDNSVGAKIKSKNVVLIRIYGNKTDLLIDRKAETKNIKLLHTYGFAPSLYATFNNGLCYEYIEGCTLTPDTVKLPKVWKLIAKRMAKMHKVIDPNDKRQQHVPMLKFKSEQFLNLIPHQFTDPIKHEKVKDIFLPVQKLRNEFNNLYEHLEKLNSPIVFSHNDLLLGNVIYTESLNRVTFIDYEYADYNFQAFDIGNHFAEFSGIDGIIDFSNYPTKEYQYEWLKVYLQNYLNTNNIQMNDIHKLYVQVNKFALASHFFWAIWSLIQAEHSTIDFDFVSFAKMRYQEYLSKKDEFLSLKCE